MNKILYEKYCDENDVPLFLTSKWLDIVAKNLWDFTFIQDGERYIAIMPYVIKNNIINMPYLTPFLGPNFINKKNKYFDQISNEHKIYDELLKKLPKFEYFEQRLHYSITNWLPFHWNGYQQTTKYTYILENISDIDLIWNGVRENIRREIRKSKKNGIVVSYEDVSDKLFDFLLNNLERQRKSVPFTKEFFMNIVSETQKLNCGKIFVAKLDNIIIGAVFIVYDKNSAYYLTGGVDEMYKNFGAMSLLLWEAIITMSALVKKFDFEGSMIPGVERFFRSFGAKQNQYFEIIKNDSKIRKIKKNVFEIIKTIIR